MRSAVFTAACRSSRSKVSSSRSTCTYSRRPALIIRASISRRRVANSGGRSHPGQRRRLVQRVDLLLDQRQVVHRIEDHVLAVVAPGMAGDDLAAAADHHLVDVAADPDVAVAVGDRHRVVVGLVAHQRLRADPPGGLVAGVEGRGRQVRHRRRDPAPAARRSSRRGPAGSPPGACGIAPRARR